MFETTAQTLQEMTMFAILGFAFAVLYEPLRIVRVAFKPRGIFVALADFAFLSACGLLTFAYSLEFGAGYFRFYYVIALVFGAAVYFLTVGRVVNTFSERVLKKVIGKIAQKARAKMSILREKVEKRRLGLQSRAKVWYTDKKKKIIGEGMANEKDVKEAATTRRQVIQAKITRV